METATATAAFVLSQTLNHPCKYFISKRISNRIKLFDNNNFQLPKTSHSFDFSRILIHKSSILSQPQPKFVCLSLSTKEIGLEGGGGGESGGFNGRGGGGGDGNESNSAEVRIKTLRDSSEEVESIKVAVILDVKGMSCGGCAAKVKRILESQPLVSSATVNLDTETAVVWFLPEAQTSDDWQVQFGKKLANHLTNCGFESNIRGSRYMSGELHL